jgi:hypothetical protein
MLASCSTPTPEPTATPEIADAAELCAQFGDVETIIFNAGAAFRDGRAAEQEYLGWLRLATRELSRIDANVATALGAAIANAQDVAPATPIGAVAEPFDALSTEWGDASLAVRQACTAEGIEFAIEGFTGG